MRPDQMDTGPLPIMTYGAPVITGGSHAPEEFYPHRPAGPPLRRRDPSGPPPAPGSRTRVPRRAAAHPVVLCRRPHHLALGCLQVLARRTVRRGGPAGPDRHPVRLRRAAAPAQRRPGRRPAPARAPSAAAPGRRSGLDPLSWPTAARPRRDLPLGGQERHQPLPRLRHALCDPPRLPLHRGPDGRRRRRTAGGGPQAPPPPGGRRRRPLPLVAAGSRLLQRGRDPLSPGGAAPVPDAGDLPGPRARRPAGAERDQRLLDLGAERLRHLHPARRPQAAGPSVDLRQVPLLPRPVAAAWQAAADLRLLGPEAAVLRLGKGGVSAAVRHRVDLSAVASGTDPDLDAGSGAAAVGRGDRPDLAERLGVVAPDGPGPAAARGPRDPVGPAPLPPDVAVVGACGGAGAGCPRLDHDPTSLMIKDCGSR